MSKNDDEKALILLEKAVLKAQKSLETAKHFQPFLMLLTDEGKEEVYENTLENADESYTLLETTLSQIIKDINIDILLLVADTDIPSSVSKNSSEHSRGIRLHLEEKSQIHKSIGARFIYVPYDIFRVENGNISVTLHAPIPVGFPAEYIVNDNISQ